MKEVDLQWAKAWNHVICEIYGKMPGVVQQLPVSCEETWLNKTLQCNASAQIAERRSIK